MVFQNNETAAVLEYQDNPGNLTLFVRKRKADYFILTTSSEKNFSLIASRKEKKYMKYCENHVFVWKL